ncbi:MAG TPA: YadA-like family protein, partial [Luteimonas sp.]|nr:YadA-like family protein [Luteimonas sp.]
ENSVSVGSVGNERQITNVADGRIALGSTDAVTGGQVYDALDSAAQIIGGGSEVTAFGTLSAPAFMIQGSTYFSVGDAFGAVDAQISVLNSRLTTLEGATTTGSSQQAAAASGRRMGDLGEAELAADGSAGTATLDTGGGTSTTGSGSVAVAHGQGAVATHATATAVGDGATATASNSVALGQGSVADRANTVSVGSAGNERQVTNVAAGTQATDAVNVAQLESTATQAVSTANAYTDQKFAAWNDSFSAYQSQLEQRFTDQDRRIDRQGAMGAAMLNMATSAAGIRTDNRVGVGVGFQGGQSALSVGYQRALSDRATLTIGGAFSGDEKSVGVGAGFGW